MNISMDKRYMLDSEEFIVLTVTKPGTLCVLGYTLSGAAFQFRANGTCMYGGESLVEVGLYADYKIDEPVMVRNSDVVPWCKRSFAGVTPQGTPLTFGFSNSKWSNDSDRWEWENWSQCRRPTAEELAS